MFSAYTPLDRCIGKEIKVRSGGENYTGMLSGIYRVEGLAILVLAPMNGGGVEYHIPLNGAVVQVCHEK